MAAVHVTCLAARLLAARAGRDAVRHAPEGHPPREMPVVTVLGPLHREAERVGPWLAAVEALRYPRDRLDVIVLVEPDDTPTRAAAERAWERRGRPGWLRVAAVPPGGPRTKPRALMHGLTLARGSLVAVYDAEDVPDPRQLLDAAEVFARLPADVACLQALPVLVAPPGAVLGGLMAAEYRLWHRRVLPGLARLGAPVPLAGTSNHLRMSALREVGGWDPRSVTEDADLGVRLAAAGLRTAFLTSTTREESTPAGTAAWVRQRARWSRGFLATTAVAARHRRRLGWRGSALAQLTLGGTVALQASGLALAAAPVAGPLLRAVTGRGLRAGRPEALCAAVFAAAVGLRGAAMRAAGDGSPGPGRAWAALPAYVALEGVAAVRGAAVLLRDPSRWDTTDHPLH